MKFGQVLKIYLQKNSRPVTKLQIFLSKNARPNTISSSKNNFSTQLQKLFFSNFQLNLWPNTSHAKSWDISNHKCCKSIEVYGHKATKIYGLGYIFNYRPLPSEVLKVKPMIWGKLPSFVQFQRRKFSKNARWMVSERLLALSSETNASTKAL